MAFAFPIPGEFNIHKPNDWPLYKFRLERYLRSSQFKKYSKADLIDVMLAAMGSTADELYLMVESKIVAPEPTTQVVLALFEEYMKPKLNIVGLRAKFGRSKQTEGDSSDTFLCELWASAMPCDFPDKEDRIRDQFITGLLNTKLSLSLQNDPKMTLDKATTKARTWEELRSEDSVLKNRKKKSELCDIDAVNAGEGRSQCPRCGTRPSHPIRICPAKNATCFQCGGDGHWAQHCKAKAPLKSCGCPCTCNQQKPKEVSSVMMTTIVSEDDLIPCPDFVEEDAFML
jgi:hypothetical protein